MVMMVVMRTKDFAQRITNAAAYNWGDRLAFGKGGNAGPFQGQGWSDSPDEHSTWTVGPEADLLFRFVPPPSDVVLNLKVAPFVVEGIIEHQSLTVYFNYFRVAFFEIAKPTELTVYLPRELFSLRASVLTFHIPRCHSPQTLQRNLDVRRLGIAFGWITLIPIT